MARTVTARKKEAVVGQFCRGVKILEDNAGYL
jgi:hypothetical protein